MSESSDLRALAESNARSIAATNELLQTGFQNVLQAINEQNQLISELRLSQQATADQVAKNAEGITANNQQIQVLINESRENVRQHRDFVGQFEAITETLQQLMSQLLSRINDIWDRLQAS